MIKVGLIGIVAALLACFIRKERAELSIGLGIAAGMIVFYYVLTQISVVVRFITELLELVAVEETYFFQLVKMLGVAYVAEFSSSVCKDAGSQSIASMIEIFAKISIVTLSIPGVVFLIKTLEQFV